MKEIKKQQRFQYIKVKDETERFKKQSKKQNTANKVQKMIHKK